MKGIILPQLGGFVGTNPQVGGSSPFQLTAAHARDQTINPAGAVTVKLPSDVKAGEEVTINNRSANTATIQPSGDSNTFALVINGTLTAKAVVDNPTGLSDWFVKNYYSTGTQSGSANGISFNYYWTRNGKNVTLLVYGTGTISGNPGNLAVSVSNALMPIQPTDSREPLQLATVTLASSRTRVLLSIWSAGSSNRIDIFKEDGSSFTNGQSFETGDSAGTGSQSICISYVIT